MFENLRRAFGEAISNFKEELGRDDVPEAVDALLKGMVAEVTDATAYVKKLESDIEQTEAKIERQKRAAETARRRETLASEIGDGDTAGVAQEFAAKHERMLEVLQHKEAALREELRVRQAELADMMAQLKAARADRDRLTATAGRAQSRNTLTEADDLFAQMDRMAEKIEGTQSEADAARELDDLGLGSSTPRVDPDLDQQFDALEDRKPEIDYDAALEELKRRMGKE